MLEEYKKIYEEREEQNKNEYENIIQNNKFNLSYIDFYETNKKLEEDKKNRENESKNNINENSNKIIFELKAEMRKDLYILIDRMHNKNNSIHLIGKKRKSNNVSFSNYLYSETHSNKNEKFFYI